MKTKTTLGWRTNPAFARQPKAKNRRSSTKSNAPAASSAACQLTMIPRWRGLYDFNKLIHCMCPGAAWWGVHVDAAFYANSTLRKNPEAEHSIVGARWVGRLACLLPCNWLCSVPKVELQGPTIRRDQSLLSRTKEVNPRTPSPDFTP